MLRIQYNQKATQSKSGFAVRSPIIVRVSPVRFLDYLEASKRQSNIEHGNLMPHEGDQMITAQATLAHES